VSEVNTYVTTLPQITASIPTVTGENEEPPRDTIGQIAGYIAFVKKNVPKAKGHKVVGWIMARPSSQADDQILEEAAFHLTFFPSVFDGNHRLPRGEVSTDWPRRQPRG